MSDNTLYDLLGISRLSTEDEIKKAYKKQALLWHPDRNPDRLEEADKKFKEISEANDVLSNPEKRRIYDQRGLAGLKEPSHFHGIIPRGPDIQHIIEVTLNEIYTGATKEIKFDKLIICMVCKGSGGIINAKPINCANCSGKGYSDNHIQIAPGFVINQQGICQKCTGTGKSFSSIDVCKCCWGERRTKKETVLTCVIQPGISNGEKICFKGESHEVLGLNGEKAETGNFFAVIKEMPHSEFSRSGSMDLLCRKTITLKGALCGTTFDIIHLDGKTLSVNVNSIITPGYKKVLENQGMVKSWFSRTDKAYGNLVVEFQIEFPKILDENQKLSLAKIL